jgi:hypothetical protein
LERKIGQQSSRHWRSIFLKGCLQRIKDERMLQAMNAGGGLTIRRMLKLGRVSRSGFYRCDPEHKLGADRDLELRDAIQRIALEWPCYGWPRITEQLRRQGWTVNPKRVNRLMREDNLLCVRKRKFVVTTDSNHTRRIYPNLVASFVHISFHIRRQSCDGSTLRMERRAAL